MQKIDVELDDIQLIQLQQFARLNNSSEQEACRVLIKQKLDALVDEVLTEFVSDKKKQNG